MNFERLILRDDWTGRTLVAGNAPNLTGLNHTDPFEEFFEIPMSEDPLAAKLDYLESLVAMMQCLADDLWPSVAMIHRAVGCAKKIGASDGEIESLHSLLIE